MAEEEYNEEYLILFSGMQRDFPTELMNYLHSTPLIVYANEENMSIQTQGSVCCKWLYDWALDALESSEFFGKNEGWRNKNEDLWPWNWNEVLADKEQLHLNKDARSMAHLKCIAIA